MKYFLILIAGLILMSCGTRVPYTNEIRDDFGLESKDKVKNVQFFTSASIVLEQSKDTDSQGTAEDGTLIANSNSEQERIIIPTGTACVFEGYGENGEIILRFETGVNKTITFSMRQGQVNGKYYFVANWTKNGGEVKYGNINYVATSSSGTAYLQVLLKKLKKTKRKDRVVKGMKV